MRRGFTIVELVIVVAILGIVSLLSLPLLAGDPTRKDVSLYAGEAMDAIREAQFSAMSGKNNARFGVHFETTQFVFFQGAAYSSSDANNVVHALPGRVTVTAVSLSPGGACTVATGTGNCDLHFASRKGIPTETGTITLSGDDGTARTISINAAGMVDVN